MLKNLLLATFLAVLLFGCAHASPLKRFTELGCNAGDFASAIPSVCRTAFSYDEKESSEHDIKIKHLATEVFAAELRVSLAHFNRYSLILYAQDDSWELTAFAGRKDSEFANAGIFGKDFRSVHFSVPEDRVAVFKQELEARELSALLQSNASPARVLENGDVVGIVCLDSASLQAKYVSPDAAWSAHRHNCVGRTDIDDFADALFDLAVEFDPKLEAYRFTLPRDDKTQ